MNLHFLILLLFACTVMGVTRSKRRSSRNYSNTTKPKRYKSKVYDVVTENMCKRGYYRSWKMCNALKRDRKRLKRIVEDHKCLFQHLTNSTSTSESNASTNNQSELEWFSEILDTSNGTSDSRSSHNVRKRSTTSYNNPCKGTLRQTAVYYGEDVVDGQRYELVHDPANYLYQTFFLWTCNTFIHQQFECIQHDIIFKSLVFTSAPGEGYNVGTKVVRVKGSCALSLIS